MFKSFLSTITQLFLGGILIFGALIAIVFTISIIVQIVNDKSSLIADGYENILITLGIFAGFCFWQYKSLQTDFSFEEGKEGKSKMVLILFGLALIPAVLMFFTNILSVYFQMGWVRSISGKGIGMTTPGADTSFVVALLDSFYQAGLSFGLVFAVLIGIFRIGIFTSKLSFCIALHNYFNGLSFDLSVLFDLVFETTLSEFWGAVLTIGQLALTFFVGRKFGGAGEV